MNLDLHDSLRLYEAFHKVRWALLLFVAEVLILAFPMVLCRLLGASLHSAGEEDCVVRFAHCKKFSVPLMGVPGRCWPAQGTVDFFANLSGLGIDVWRCNMKLWSICYTSATALQLLLCKGGLVELCETLLKISTPQLASFVLLNLADMFFPFCFLHCYPALLFKNYPCGFK